METQNPWYNAAKRGDANQNEDFGNSEPEAPTVEAKCEKMGEQVQRKISRLQQIGHIAKEWIWKERVID